MADNSFKVKNSLNIQPVAGAAPTAEGDIAYNLSTNKASLHNGTTASPIVTEAHSATLTNKTFDADGTGNSISNIENADIKTGAAIALNKLATTTASRALVSDGSGVIVPATTTATEIGYVNGVTSSIQTQLNNLAASASNSYEITNLGLATSVGSSALTIALKQADGSTDPSTGTAAVKIGMRSSTATSGLYNQRSATAATSLVISSGSTLGQTSGQPAAIWIYLIDNAGTLELAASGAVFHENQLVSTTAEGGAGAADSASVMYSTTARSNVPCRLIGKLVNTQTTAGTWASAGTSLQVGIFSSLITFTPPTIQKFTTGSGTYNTPAGVRYLRVRMVAGGGGGGGGGSGASAGTAGGDTTFGTSLLTAVGGGAGAGSGGASGAGGTVTMNSPAIGTALPGAVGTSSPTNAGGSTLYISGGTGASTPFGGGGAGQSNNAATPGASNTGAGGGGGGTSNAISTAGGCGGSAGGYIDALLTTVLTSYAYAVGAAGTLGSAGSNGYNGGTGGSGYIEVTEYYN